MWHYDDHTISAIVLTIFNWVLNHADNQSHVIQPMALPPKFN
jgi:hypothetical protein